MPAGRPTKYTPELLEAAWAYLEHYEEAGDPVPSVVGLALSIGITKKTCYEWAKDADKTEFSDILTRVEAQQEQKLIAGGLTQGFNPAITKMMMTKPRVQRQDRAGPHQFRRLYAAHAHRSDSTAY